MIISTKATIPIDFIATAHGKDKDRLNIENDKQDGEQVIPHIKLKPGGPDGRNATLVRLSFLGIRRGRGNVCGKNQDASHENEPNQKKQN